MFGKDEDRAREFVLQVTNMIDMVSVRTCLHPTYVRTPNVHTYVHTCEVGLYLLLLPK